MDSLPLGSARRPIRAARDNQGVVHLDAHNWHDALYGLGYLHGLDRPTQVMFARVVAQGRAAELIDDAPELLEADRYFRRVGLYLSATREVAALDEAARAQIDSYCAGLNDGLVHAGRSLPMWAVGFHPEPWDAAAVLLVGNLLNYNGLAVSQLENERLLVELIQTGVNTALITELLAPRLDAVGRTEVNFDLLRRIAVSNHLSDAALEMIADLPRLIGSNAWAVAPRRTSTGSAMLAADPHLEVNRLPAIWYETVLRWGDQYVLGASLPGCPLFGIGRTRQLAWGVTYLKADTADFFVEDCRHVDGRWEYRRGENWRPFDVRTEAILRRHGPAETVRVLSNEVGTLEVDPGDQPSGYYLSSCWTGANSGVAESLSTWMRVVGCASVREAMDGVRSCPQPSLVWVFADRAGHIGRQASGAIPRRPAGVSGLLPIAAWDTANHWQGCLDPDDLPAEYDPPRGYVSSANEDPADAASDFNTLAPIATQPLTNYRKRRIDEQLSAWDQVTIEQLQQLQYDVVSLQARDLLAVFLPHLEPGPLRARLAAWNCGYEPESLEATLFTRLYRNVLVEVFGQEPGRPGGFGWRRVVYLVSRVGFSMMIVAAIDRLLAREDSLWWAGRNKGELIRRAAERLAGETEQAWGVTNAFRFTNRFVESRFVGRALGFHTSELPLRGCHATPFQGHLLRVARRELTFAPSYHFTTDLGTDEAWTNQPGGASESWLSRWYKNDIPNWLAGRYKRVTASRDESTSPAPPAGE